MTVMSRSYKKNPIVTEPSTNHRNYPRPKTIVNRIVRRHLKHELRKEISSHFDDVISLGASGYKKYYESYYINDYAFDLRDIDSSTRSQMNDDEIRQYYQK